MDEAKRNGRKKHAHKPMIRNKALLHEASRPASGKLLAPASEIRKHVSAALEKDIETKERDLQPARKTKKTFHSDPDNNEKVDVFKIISDLEKQLDAAFSVKDAQENEIQGLKENLFKAREEAKELEAELEEIKSKLIAQKKLELELESFENEKLEILSEKKSLRKEIEERSAIIKDLESKVTSFAKESEAWNARIGQMEMDLSSANATIQNLRRKIFALEDEKDVLSNKIEAVEAELSSVTIERERYKKELNQAKESLDEIRLTLVETRSRARGHYYKKKN